MGTEPTDEEFKALCQLHKAYQSLKLAGWTEPRYFKFPADEVEFEGIELGSTGIHKIERRGGYFWADKQWPCSPILVRERGRGTSGGGRG